MGAFEDFFRMLTSCFSPPKQAAAEQNGHAAPARQPAGGGSPAAPPAATEPSRAAAPVAAAADVGTAGAEGSSPPAPAEAPETSSDPPPDDAARPATPPPLVPPPVALAPVPAVTSSLGVVWPAPPRPPEEPELLDPELRDILHLAGQTDFAALEVGPDPGADGREKGMDVAGVKSRIFLGREAQEMAKVVDWTALAAVPTSRPANRA
ncbi:hypothetical protein DFJ74DRAFT_703376 [Hyaloraphidium curvatum]|nr:hypothetical protein DFJ74DRAFT_703376 [Hyaloraphidium curvatum]